MSHGTFPLRDYHKSTRTGKMKINPQIQNEITECVKALRENKFVVFPCETGWNICCTISDQNGIQKLLSETQLTGHAVLLDEAGKLNKFIANIPDTLWDLVEFSTRPLTIMFSPVANLPVLLQNEKGEVAFRVVKNEFTSSMVHRLGNPVFSASIPEIMKPATGGRCTILNTPAYMVNLRTGSAHDPGVIMRLSTGSRIEFIRK